VIELFGSIEAARCRARTASSGSPFFHLFSSQVPEAITDFQQELEIDPGNAATALPLVTVSHADTVGTTSVSTTLTNSSSSLAFLIRARVLDAGGNEVLPVWWTDNYITLLPGESRTLTASYFNNAAPPSGATVHLDGFGKQDSTTAQGLSVFNQIGCNVCHIQNLQINHDRRVADVNTVYDPVNGNFNTLFATATKLVNIINDGTGLPPLQLPQGNSFLVNNIFTDFKRHDPNFYERNYDGTLQTQFLTRPCGELVRPVPTVTTVGACRWTMSYCVTVESRRHRAMRTRNCQAPNRMRCRNS